MNRRDFTKSLALMLAAIGLPVSLPRKKGAQSPAGVPTYVGSGTASSGVGVFGVPLPSGVRPGDLLLLVTEGGQAPLVSDGTWIEMQGEGKLAVFYSRHTKRQRAPVILAAAQTFAMVHAFRGVSRTGNPFAIRSEVVESADVVVVSTSG